MRKINWEPIKAVVQGTVEIVGIGLVTFASLWCASKEAEFSCKKAEACVAGYSDAVNAIAKSDMNSYFKQEAIRELKRDGDEEFYKAIANIANAEDINSYYKAELIQELSAK